MLFKFHVINSVKLCNHLTELIFQKKQKKKNANVIYFTQKGFKISPFVVFFYL